MGYINNVKNISSIDEDTNNYDSTLASSDLNMEERMCMEETEHETIVLCDKVKEIIEHLPDGFKVPLKLYLYEDMPYKDIIEKIQEMEPNKIATMQTVKNRIHGARLAIRKECEMLGYI